MIYLLIYSFIDIMNEKVRSKIVSLLKKTLQLQVLFQLSDNACLCLLAGKYSALRSGLHSINISIDPKAALLPRTHHHIDEPNQSNSHNSHSRVGRASLLTSCSLLLSGAQVFSGEGILA